MEEGRSFKKRKNFTYMAVDISPTFTRDYTNGHDIRREERRNKEGRSKKKEEEKEKVFWSRERNGVLSLIIRT
ncbi:hypothetical protein [Okeania sp. SIO1I7]|uniref:hypothetical protein n=1 Tax=Okeania sp. SIO1I7 TaxID=2607772 RepID=UPI0013FC64A4|nr:hypothetical protein [Okeania sp. SIO1I7]NET28171.1 hypothetical protein [Okeania sp. SIO1I7]